MTSEGRGKGLSRAEECSYAGTHLAEGVEDAVQDDEEWEDGLDWVQRTAEDEAKDRPACEAEAHGLFAADAVHEEAADETAGEVELLSSA